MQFYFSQSGVTQDYTPLCTCLPVFTDGFWNRRTDLVLMMRSDILTSHQLLEEAARAQVQGWFASPQLR